MTTTTTVKSNAAKTSSTGRPSRRFAKIVTVLAVPAAVAVSGLVVSQASYSAYSATTVNPESNWATGTVALADDDHNIAALTAANLKPGATATHCIAVTSSGTLASTVKVYGTNPGSTNDLAAHLDLTITQGTGGGFGGCTGFTPLPEKADLYQGTLEEFGKAHTGYTTGLTSWAPTGHTPETRTYQVSYTLDDNAPNSTQKGTARLGLTWEAQNN
jgi:hypothetical protein